MVVLALGVAALVVSSSSAFVIDISSKTDNHRAIHNAATVQHCTPSKIKERQPRSAHQRQAAGKGASRVSFQLCCWQSVYLFLIHPLSTTGNRWDVCSN
jgi:hypothetical protein